MNRLTLAVLSLLCIACAVGVAMVARALAESLGASPRVTSLAMSAAVAAVVAPIVILALQSRKPR